MESAQSSEGFLEAWKRESAACVNDIFMSLWIDGPFVSGALRQEAVENIMRIVWYRVEAPDKGEALRKNLDAVKEYTGELVDKAVSERWQRAADRGSVAGSCRRPRADSPCGSRARRACRKSRP